MAAEIYIGETLLDLFEDTAITLNLSLFDIEDFTRRKVFKTGKINIPLTKTNLAAIGYVDDISAEALEQLTGHIIQDGLTFSGNVEVYETENDYGNRTTAIQIVQSDWLATIEGLKLSDLDLSSLTHTKTAANISTTVSGTTDETYIYPLIDFGKFKGETEVLAIDREIAINIYWLIKSIFNEAGYKIASGSYFNTYDNWFFLPSEKIELNDSNFIKDRLFQAASNGESSATSWGHDWHTVIFADITTGDNFTGNDNYDNATGEYTVDKAGAYRFKTDVRVLWNALQSPTVYCAIYKNSSTVVSDSFVGGAINNNTFSLDTSFLHLEQDDVITVRVLIDDSTAYLSSITSGVSYIFNDVDQRRGLGYYFTDLSEVMPDMEQKEFLQIVKNTFNLYFYSNPYTREILIIDRDSFYTDYGQDWTSKVDKSKPITITQPNAPNRIIYGYEEDSADYIATVERISDTETAMNSKSLTVQDARISNAGATYLGESLRIGIRLNDIPVIWKERDYITIPDPDFTFKPKIFKFTGQGAGDTWTFEGVSQTDTPTLEALDPTSIASMYSNFNRCLLESRTVTLTAILTAKDINSLIVMQPGEDFRTPILIDIDKINGYFYLISVSGWDGRTAKLTLLQAKDKNYYQDLTRSAETIENDSFTYYLPFNLS